MIPQLNDFLYLVTGSTAVWLALEIDVVLVCLLVFAGAFFCPRRFGKMQRLSFLRPLENALNRFAQRRALAILTVGVLALALNAAISLGGQMPQPSVHDEFSYLLAADTFAHERLSNPMHQFWQHFESFHIIQQPTYNSKYPPGQGLMLAIGQVLFALPVAGSWLGTAFACMAICWALQQWLRARTAFLGGLLAVVHPVIIFWTQGFWGNQLALLGGALVVGALPFFSSENRMVPSRAGWIFGVGCALMLITRPFEGAALTAFLLVVIAGQLLRRPKEKQLDSAQPLNALRRSVRAVLPIAIVLCGTLGFWGFYNYRVTGKATRMPYAVHHQTYGISPLFIWEKFRPTPVYRHRELRVWHTTEEPPAYLRHRTPGILWIVSWDKIGRLFYMHCQLLALAAGVLL